MRHSILLLIFGLVMLAVTPRELVAQAPSKIIDTDKLVVKPTDTATSILGGTTRYVSRVVAGTLDNHGVVKTLNNLFGRKERTEPVQGGLSPLPPVSSYPSTYFKSPLQPAMPKSMTIQR